VHDIAKQKASFRLSDEQRIDWLWLIRSQNVGPRYYGANATSLVALPSTQEAHKR